MITKDEMLDAILAAHAAWIGNQTDGRGYDWPKIARERIGAILERYDLECGKDLECEDDHVERDAPAPLHKQYGEDKAKP